MKVRHLALLGTGIALGVGSALIARAAPGSSLSGGSAGAVVVLLGVGWALLACGLVAWTRRPASRFGALLAAASTAWFLVEYSNPEVGSPLLFTAGLLTYAACPAIVAHAALAYPGGRVAGGFERAGLALAYASTLGALGLLPTLFFDPAAQGCTECPSNLLSVVGDPSLVDALMRAGLVLGLVWTCLLAAGAVWRVLRASTAARLLTVPVLVPLVAYLGLVAAGYAHGVERGYLSNDSVDRALWLGQAAALALLVLGVCVAWVREWRARVDLEDRIGALDGELTVERTGEATRIRADVPCG